MYIEKIGKLVYEKELMGYRFKLCEGRNHWWFDIDRESLLKYVDKVALCFTFVKNVKLTLHQGMLKTRYEMLENPMVVNDLESNAKALQFVIGVLSGSISNSKDILVNDTTYPYKKFDFDEPINYFVNFSISDVVDYFLRFSGISTSKNMQSYTAQGLYYHPLKNEWFFTVYIEELAPGYTRKREVCTSNRVYRLKLGSGFDTRVLRDKCLTSVKRGSKVETCTYMIEASEYYLGRWRSFGHPYSRRVARVAPMEFSCFAKNDTSFSKFSIEDRGLDVIWEF